MPLETGETTSGVVGRKLIVIGDYTCATQILDLDTQSWSIGAPRAFCGSHHGGAVVDDVFYLIGGWDLDKSGTKVQAYNVATDTWGHSLPPPEPVASPAVMTVDETIWLCGGVVVHQMGPYVGSKGKSSKCFSRNFSKSSTNSQWVRGPELVFPVHHTAHGSSTDGSLFIFGGKYNNKNKGNPGTNRVQVLRSGSMVWEELQPMPIARGGMGHAPYFRGEFYVLGGETNIDNEFAGKDTATFPQVTIYNPALGTWRRGPDMLIGMHGIYPVIDPFSGSLYVAGGAPKAGMDKTSRVFILD